MRYLVSVSDQPRDNKGPYRVLVADIPLGLERRVE